MEYKFEEVDSYGEHTLEVIDKAHRFNEWMYRTIAAHCKGNVLEIGSGLGNISQYFLRDGFNIVLSDIRTGYCEKLQQKFEKMTNLRGVENIDLVDPEFDRRHAHLLGTFDTVFALNVVEHISDDLLALRNAAKLLRKDGHVVILVPAYRFLLNKFDEQLGHFRRYTTSSLSKVLKANNLDVIHRQYFNFAGTLGWFVSGKIMGNKEIGGGEMALFDKLVPLFRLVDKLIFRKAGLSAIAVGRKR